MSDKKAVEEKRRQALLEHYAEAPVRRFMQIDAGYIGEEGADYVCIPDADGDVVFDACRDELQKSDWEVRIRVCYGADLRLVRRLLHKIMCYLETVDEEAFYGDVTELPAEAVLGARGWCSFSRLTGPQCDEGEEYPGWYDYHK